MQQHAQGNSCTEVNGLFEPQTGLTKECMVCTHNGHMTSYSQCSLMITSRSQPPSKLQSDAQPVRPKTHLSAVQPMQPDNYVTDPL